MALIASLFLRSSLERKESRMDHLREDFPRADPGWLKWINVSKCADGRAAIEHEPVPLSTYRQKPKGLDPGGTQR